MRTAIYVRAAAHRQDLTTSLAPARQRAAVIVPVYFMRQLVRIFCVRQFALAAYT